MSYGPKVHVWYVNSDLPLLTLNIMPVVKGAKALSQFPLDVMSGAEGFLDSVHYERSREEEEESVRSHLWGRIRTRSMGVTGSAGGSRRSKEANK